MRNRRLANSVVWVAMTTAACALLDRHAFDRPIIDAATARWTCWGAMILWWFLRYGTFWLRRRAEESPRGLNVEAVLCGLVTLAGFLPAGAAALPPEEMFALFAMGALLVDLAGEWARRMLAAEAVLRDVLIHVVAAWTGLWFVGTVLLALPASTHPAVPDYAHNMLRHLSACAFMSASAASLCGATIYSPGEDLRFFGQAVLYALVQAAGWFYLVIGLVTLRPFFARQIRLRTVVLAWLAAQAVAVAWSHGGWRPASGDDIAPPWWPAVFHAASAINNCAFALRQDGLASYLDVGPVFWSMLALSLLGGIGLAIVVDRLCMTREALWNRWLRSTPPAASPRKPNRSASTGSVESRPPGPLLDLNAIELHTNIWILCIAAGGLWLLEAPGIVPPMLASSRPVYMEVHQATLGDMRPGDRWRAALLVSAAARSTGLHVAPLSQGAVTWPTWAFLIGLMTLGGAAGSAAAGVRTGTVAIALCRQRFNRAGLRDVPRLALRILVAVPLLMLAAAGLLRWTQPQWSAWDVCLHAASLVNGVGWTTGLTPHLTGAARVGMIVAMFCGRMVPTLGWCCIAARMPATAARPAAPGPGA